MANAVVAAPVAPRSRPAAPGPVRGWPLLAVLAGVSAALVVVNVVVKVLADPPRDMGAWLVAFDVNREMNVPTVWNGMLLLAVAACSVLVAALAPTRAGGRVGWVLAAVVAALMAFDEMLRWHEGLRSAGAALRAVLPVSVPTYAWVLPGLAVGALVVAAAATWSRSLPRDVRALLRLAVLTFFLGALGAEAVSGWVELRWGTRTAYTLVTAGEEALEMLGCVLAVAALLRMLEAPAVGGRRVLGLRSGT